MPKGTTKASIEFLDADELRDMLNAIGDGVLDSIEEQGMLRLMNVLEAKAVQLTPVRTGNLESSTHVSVRTRGGIVEGVLEFRAPYAATVHELPEQARGPQTRLKPGNEYGEAGPQYLARPLAGFQREMARGVADFLKRIWGKPRGRRR
jgi:hypothetical protein